MRVGIFTDVHGNLPAAQTLLAEFSRIGVDLVVHAGDSVSIGPQPIETLDLLLESDVQMIIGNHELSLRDNLWRTPPDWMVPGERDHEEWASGLLTDAHREAIDAMPLVHKIQVGDCAVVFQHFNYDVPQHIFNSFPRLAANLAQYFIEGHHSVNPPDMVVHGHDHRQVDRVFSGAHFVSPGPAGTTKTDQVPFGVIEISEGGSETTRECATFTQHWISYPREKTIAEIRSRKIPDGPQVLKLFFGVES